MSATPKPDACAAVYGTGLRASPPVPVYCELPPDHPGEHKASAPTGDGDVYWGRHRVGSNG